MAKKSLQLSRAEAAAPASTVPQYAALLLAELKRRRSRNPRYTQSALARDLGLAPNHLSEILRGKRGLSVAQAGVLARALALTGPEADLFCDLVEASHSRSRATREAAGRRLVEEPSKRYRPLPPDVFRCFSDWAAFAILEATKLEGFVASVDWLSEKLALPPERVRDEVERLVRLGMLERSADGWRAREPDTCTGRETPSIAVKRYHESLLARGRRALYRQRVEDREVASLVVALNRDSLPHFKRRLREMVRELDREADRSGRKTDVYAFSLQMFRLGKDDPNG